MRARTAEQVATHAPVPKRIREPIERPAPIKRDRVSPPSLDETVEVFVTRISNQSFSWQLRRFGAIVIQEGQKTYVSAHLAREAGEAALGAL